MRHSISLVLTLSVITSCGVFGGADEEQPPNQSPVENPGPGTPAPPLDGTPKEDQINEKYGIFVVPNAASGGDGTRAKPFATIAAGLEGAIAQSKRLYVCAGTFNESVKVANGISMIGGFDCSKPTWPTSEGRTQVNSPTSPAITAEKISAPTRIEGFEFIAPDGTDAQPTSIGLRALEAGSLVFARSRIAAGKGRDGAAGTEGVQVTLGASAKGGNGYRRVQDTTTSFFFSFPIDDNGGAGGTGACEGAPGITPGAPGGKGGEGGSYDSVNECRGGTVPICGNWYKTYFVGPVGYTPGNGVVKTPTPGGAGTDGASATAPGALSAEGFTPADGTAGTNGKEGAGGSGGNGEDLNGTYAGQNKYALSASGPGGGAGGCPGLAGTAGKGGAASIGALLVTSAVTFDATEVVAAAGGAGGKGAFGSSPTPGGAPGTPDASATPAQAGGAGGRSGVSGSGAGGSSYGIAATGGEPKLLNGATAKAGPAGAGVPEETKNDALGNPKTMPASVDGDAKDQFNF